MLSGGGIEDVAEPLSPEEEFEEDLLLLLLLLLLVLVKADLESVSGWTDGSSEDEDDEEVDDVEAVVVAARSGFVTLADEDGGCRFWMRGLVSHVSLSLSRGVCACLCMCVFVAGF